ncbi:MAG: glycosyltransferase family 2 protein [Proteobacteria bacterium]|nr:glycosyltransferase family 2 protein [Pseudomonadota bacterium]
MKVSVCIVGFRNLADIESCIEALERTDWPSFEVVVCENGGPESYRQLLKVLPSQLPGGQAVRIIQAPSNVGYAGGVNLCMDQTPDADAWWILNPDTVPNSDALSKMCRRLEGDGCAMVGCTVYHPNGVVESRGGRWIPWLARAVSIDHGAPITNPTSEDMGATVVSYVSGASLLVGRALVQKVGRMREDYFLYGEEVEWCLRARAYGARLVVARDAEVLHRQGTTTGSIKDAGGRSRLAVFLDERNKLLITRDRFPALVPISAMGALAMLLLRFARRGAWAQTGYALSGWWSGIIGRRGKPAWVS